MPNVEGSTNQKLRILLVTGVSGAGRSTALKILEDMGYEAMDNIPLHLLLTLLEPPSSAIRTRHGAIAAGIEASPPTTMPTKNQTDRKKVKLSGATYSATMAPSAPAIPV